MSEATDQHTQELARLRSELANVQRRAQRERTQDRDEMMSEALMVMVEALEQIERALDHRPGDADLLALHRYLVARAQQSGLQEVGCGAGFDPILHESVGRREIAGVAPGTIVEVLRTGWRYRDRLLRPALVVVCQAERP